MKIEDSLYITEYRKRMITAIKKIHPSWDELDIEDIINDMIRKNVSNPSTELDNNYTHTHVNDASLISIFDWIIKEEPIISGNGTFYKNQHKAFNPIAKMLMGWLADRKAVKKEMFKIEDTESDQYKNLDRKQSTIKVNVNSYYGGSGMPSSAFYSTYSGPKHSGCGT
jgi:DNA polymerase elongation subunit (family B)